MGSPLSGLLADIFLNNFENTYLLSSHNKWHHNIMFYKRYVDDTFVIFNGTARQAGMMSVSYTHLDVYKRQLQNCMNVDIRQEQVWV